MWWSRYAGHHRLGHDTAKQKKIFQHDEKHFYDIKKYEEFSNKESFFSSQNNDQIHCHSCEETGY